MDEFISSLRDRPTFLEQQLPPVDNVGKVQPFLIEFTTEVCTVEERADEQAAASFRDHPAFLESAFRDHPAFLEQQLPPLDNVGKVQPFLIGTTADVCAVEERAAEQTAASLSDVATSASATTHIAAGTEACDMNVGTKAGDINRGGDMTVGTDTTILMPSPTSTTSTTDRVTLKTDVAECVTTNRVVDHTRGQGGVMAGHSRVVVNGSGNVGSMTKVRLGLFPLVAHLAMCCWTETTSMLDGNSSSSCSPTLMSVTMASVISGDIASWEVSATCNG